MNDSVSLFFPSTTTSPIARRDTTTSLYTYDITSRDAILANLQVFYAPYTVEFRSFEQVIRNGVEGVNFKFALRNPDTGNHLTAQQLATVVQSSAAISALEGATLVVYSGSLDNISIDDPGAIVMIVCSAIGIIFTGFVYFLSYRLRRSSLANANRWRSKSTTSLQALNALPDSWYSWDILSLGIAVLFAYGMTDAVEPNVSSCRAQVAMIPFSFGIIVPYVCLLQMVFFTFPVTLSLPSSLFAKSYEIYIRRKNKYALLKPVEMPLRRISISLWTFIHALHWV